jgi:glycosyltransferase involved in cell wall biosynthesis
MFRKRAQAMWREHTITVVLPTYNERDSIRECIGRFAALGCVDEIIVVNNNAAAGTSEEVARTSAREVFEPVQGYGQSIRRGLREATGDWVVICEPDGTFAPEDLYKLLAYAQDFGYVIGTRTTRTMIWAGANMGLFLKWGNWAVAKMGEFLFNATILTDVGCTYRLISRDVLDRIAPGFTRKGSDFGLEITLLIMRNKIPFVEIPVNYMPRVGVSAVTGSFWKAVALGFRMIGLILRYRFGRGGVE